MEKIVIMVLITLTMGQAKEDLDTMKEMMAEMNERLDRTEAELAITKGALMSNIEELEMKTEMMAEMEMRMNECLVRTEAELVSSKADHAITKAKTDELEREVVILKAPPFIHACGSHYESLSASSGTIPYTSLLYSSTNLEDGGLDINTGVFTAPWGGSYTVSWYTAAVMDPGKYVDIYLQKNGENILESHHHSYYGGNEHVTEQGKLL